MKRQKRPLSARNSGSALVTAVIMTAVTALLSVSFVSYFAVYTYLAKEKAKEALSVLDFDTEATQNACEVYIACAKKAHNEAEKLAGNTDSDDYEHAYGALLYAYLAEASLQGGFTITKTEDAAFLVFSCDGKYADRIFNVSLKRPSANDIEKTIP